MAPQSLLHPNNPNKGNEPSTDWVRKKEKFFCKFIH